MEDGQGYGTDRGESLQGGLPFLVTASHELKGPLALVRQLSLALESGAASEAERERMLRQITLVSERALRLTTNLTRAARLEDSFFDMEPVNPVQLCEDVAHELTPLYIAKGRKLYVAPRLRPALVVANRDLLRRIILNFGDNALHYAAEDAPVELRVGVRQGGEMVRIGVRDYGPALPADIWKTIQHRIGTVRQPIHARPQSSGLGLYIAGQFAEAMHGTVGATRHRDGSTFYVDMRASTQLRLL
ncbi:HAMP domain-containing sensor histidine kinase [Streptomyces caniscabiei]|uniref:sensor histidine kinase n=1 Tax=Streptomyces caniscabiei TaxID=2746961 RepID=UPI0029AA6406|nr:HAMP domain-containing sensor histidine kinase [Streptomyces caniscabiei]MDX2776190.1 HAMP domain-containing sensor histidine kinase [Streptomyces caniscabiei]